MQKLHIVTLSSPNHAPYVRAYMGTKESKSGKLIPLAKGDAIELAFADLWGEKYGIDLGDVRSANVGGKYVSVVGISAKTLAQCSELYRSHVLACEWRATVETETFVGMAANAVGKKRDANGKKIRKRNKKNAPKVSAPKVSAPKVSAPKVSAPKGTLNKLAAQVKKA